MNRRNFLRLTGATLAATALQAQQDKPNVLLILADDLGWGDLGCYGNKEIQTPNIDKLATQCTLFNNYYSNSPVCSPSRTAWTTGQLPARHKMHGHLATAEQNDARGMPNWLDPSVVTLPGLLQKAGYATAHFGKWHLGSGEGAPTPAAYGFDEHKAVQSSGNGWKEEKEDPYFRANSTALIVDEAIRFIEKNKGKPWYVNVWPLLPHATLDPTPEQMKPYEKYLPGTPNHKGAKVVYYSSVTALDAEVGRLLTKMDELGVSKTTIVVFSSDNGPEDIHVNNASHSAIGSAGPFRGRKRSLYEGGVRLPLLVRLPGRTKANHVDEHAIIQAVDFLPTVCKIANVNVPKDWALDGEDVRFQLVGLSSKRKKPVFWQWRFNIAGDLLNRSPMLAVREGEWKLLMNPDRSRVELYDIPKDPMEMTNLADAKHDIVKKLSDMLLAWYKTLPEGPNDPGAGKNSYPWPKGK